MGYSRDLELLKRNEPVNNMEAQMLEKLKEILAWLQSGADEQLRKENEKLKAELAEIKTLVDEIYEYIK